MSKDDLGSNEDFDSEQDRGDQFTPEQTSGSFDALLEDLNEKMVSGRLASRLRNPFSWAGRRGKETSDIEDELNGSAPTSDDAEPDAHIVENDAAESSDETREFISSLDERFPSVRSPKMPPPPTLEDEAKTSESSEEAQAISDSDDDLSEDAVADHSLTEETKHLANISKSFIKARAAKIAAAAAARENARRAKAEAKRLEKLAKEEEEELPEPVETGWGNIIDDAVSDSDSSESSPSVGEPSDDESAAVASKKEESVRERSSTSIPKATPTGAPVRMAGDTDSLKAVDSDLPKKVSFTRRGSSIMKLPSGTRVIQNSMRSVRSTVDALNEGQSIDPTRPTIALFAALMVAATIVSLTTMAGTHTFSSSIFNIEPKPTEVVEATEEAPSEAPTPPPAGAPKIASIDVISYNNDDGDHPEWAQYLFDGDQSTRWQTRYFAQPELPEDNRIRLVIHLAEESSVKSVSFQGPIDGGQVDLRVNDGSDPFATPVLTSSKMAKTTTLTPSEPAVGTTVTLDFVALPTDDEGQFRAKIDELTLN
ncbi:MULTISPECIES: hypothetical protein [unclassified Actinomyces]|uniref:hypothetical protein n=1 Tax=unclassified Actinomyces TaxID=2609248 RepID=UPI0008A39CE3|nr:MULTISPECIES: hypothetical protein [unclassified Actinomyces]MDU7239342.1 hypothetical protein [Actinomyces sp.]OFR33265.1 hypothetical protein HMPREF2891_08310 [Actinomyces sp. HMSC065F11]